MNFTYTDELDYYLVLFSIDGVEFSAIVDKESKSVVDIVTLKNGIRFDTPYNENTSLKTMNWLSLNYFDVEDALVEFFKNEAA